MRDSEIIFDDKSPLADSLKSWFESKNNELIQKEIKEKEMIGVEFMSIESVFKQSLCSKVNTMGVCLDVGDLNVFTQKNRD